MAQLPLKGRVLAESPAPLVQQVLQFGVGVLAESPAPLVQQVLQFGVGELALKFRRTPAADADGPEVYLFKRCGCPPLNE